MFRIQFYLQSISSPEIFIITRQHSAEQGREAHNGHVDKSVIIFGSPKAGLVFLDLIWNWSKNSEKRPFLGPRKPVSCSWTWFETGPKTVKTRIFLDFRSKHQAATAWSPRCCSVYICHKIVNNNRQQTTNTHTWISAGSYAQRT